MLGMRKRRLRGLSGRSHPLIESESGPLQCRSYVCYGRREIVGLEILLEELALIRQVVVISTPLRCWHVMIQRQLWASLVCANVHIVQVSGHAQGGVIVLDLSFRVAQAQRPGPPLFVMTSNLASEEIAAHGLKLRREGRREGGACRGGERGLYILDIHCLDLQKHIQVSCEFKDRVVEPILKVRYY